MAFSNKSVLSIFLFFPLFMKAQIGITLGGIFNKATGWMIEDKNNLSTYQLPGNAISAGVNYEFNLNKNRIAFVPSFHFSAYKSEVKDVGTFSNKLVQFQFNMHVYILDLKGDCNCPTFSKKGDPIKKGLFATISPGAGYIENNIQGISSNQKNVYISPDLGFGLGYDIGLNERITLTTFVNGYYFPVLKWPGLPYMLSLPSSGNRFANSDTSLQQIHAGITIRYHL